MHELFNFRCTECVLPDTRLGYFLLHINTGSWAVDYYSSGINEFGYVPCDVDGARLLYQVISDSCERRGIVFTTNVEFPRWGTVFADDKLAAAIVDRVVHHGRLVEFGSPSHRLEESLMLGRSGD